MKVLTINENPTNINLNIKKFMIIGDTSEPAHSPKLIKIEYNVNEVLYTLEGLFVEFDTIKKINYLRVSAKLQSGVFQYLYSFTLVYE